jgi:HlyD family secretion protein
MMNVPKIFEILRRRRNLVIVACVVLALVLLVGLVRSPGATSASGELDPTFVVQKGPLTIGIAEAGTIQAVEREIIISEVEGRTTIIYLIEEGSRVEEGDLLVELDGSVLQDDLVDEQIRTQNAEAAYIGARETLAVIKNQADSNVSLADLEYRFAVEDLNQYREGQYKQELMEADSKITLAEEELELAKRKLEWSEKLFKENYLSQSDRDADQLAFNRAKLDVELAKAAKQLLEEFTYKRQIAQLESDVEQKKQALERVTIKAAADVVEAEADLKAKEAEWNQQQAKETKIRDQLGKTRITAPRAGLVVYATSARGGWRGNEEPLDEGQEVRERQELIHLPTADEMMAVIQVHESNLDMLRLGLPVIVSVDALQGRTFVGKVTKIAPLPDPTSMWMNPDLKVYRTEIRIEGRQPDLRTGMSCMAEIIVDRYDEATYVPVQAVLQVDRSPTVYVKDGRRFVPRKVDIGLDNDRMVRVLAGLTPGETVLLTPPLQEGATGEDETAGSDVMPADKIKSMIEEAGNGSAADVIAPQPGGGEGPPRGEGDQRPPMTQQQREEMRKRLESMTPEQRREAMERFGRGRGGRPGGREPGGASGGER